MAPGKTRENENMPPHSIAFGFDRMTDERSLMFFLQQFTEKKLLQSLLPRLEDDEIIAMVDFLTMIMQKHLSEREYHRLFLAAEAPPGGKE